MPGQKDQILLRRFARITALAWMAALGTEALADAPSLSMPANSKTVVRVAEPLGSQTFPVGAFHNGNLPTKTVEGRISQTVWRVESNARSTMDLLVPLRDQLLSQGFVPVFACESVDCGGFDFRYAAPVLPEPEMHVDLGDYRYLLAERGGVSVMLMVSRSATAGFVQMVEVNELTGASAVESVPQQAETVATGQQSGSATPTRPALAGSALDDLLQNGGSVILEGLDFSSGAAGLVGSDYPALNALADWLKANPNLKVAVVGHTDASGGLDINVAISKKRAQSVRQYLLSRHNIPADQVEAEGAGYLAPIASNLTEAGRTKNRRVEVMVTSTQVQP